MSTAQGLALKAHGQQLVLGATDDDVKAAITAAIETIAATGRPFTINDVRDQFPDARRGLPGAMVTVAAKAGVIRKTGNYVTSTLASTRSHILTEWVGA